MQFQSIWWHFGRSLARVFVATLYLALALGEALQGARAEDQMRDANQLLRAAESFETPAPGAARAAALFTEAAKVLRHPRCANCHAPGDRPTQGEDMRAHQPRVGRGKDGFGAVGLRCQACHGERNVAAAGVPGAPNWHLAPRSAALADRSPAALCAQLKDPRMTGGMDLEKMLHHLTFDPLVLWAWEPGGGRMAAPGTHAGFVALMTAWVEAGAHCPAG